MNEHKKSTPWFFNDPQEDVGGLLLGMGWLMTVVGSQEVEDD